MLQHVDHFHDDVKLVIVYSYLTRIMLKNLQRSPIGKAQFPVLMRQAFSWYSQTRQKELLFCKALGEVDEFVTKKLLSEGELDSEMVNSLADINFYIMTHAQEDVVHRVVSMITSKSFHKAELRKAWEAAKGDISFEDWYNNKFNDHAE